MAYIKTATEPQVNLRPQTVANPPATSMPMNPLLNKAPVVAEPEEQSGREKHTVPPELPNRLFHMAANSTDIVIAKRARGGWRRVSMNTVQSDDKRFTITCIDPTRRGKWFLLKDLETGESYEETTMTSAKHKALEIRGEVEESTDPDFEENNPPDGGEITEGGFNNPLLTINNEFRNP